MDELSLLPTKLLKSELRRILEDNGYKNSKVLITLANAKGDNCFGHIYRIKATSEKKPFATLNLICKAEQTNEATCREIRSDLVYAREIHIYNKLFPLLKQFQDQKKIPQALRFYHHPKCYGTGKGFLFLNDLVAEGYSMYDRFKDLDFQHVSKAVEVLGRFHAVQFALKDQRPELFESFKQLKDKYFSYPVHEGLYNYFDVLFERSIESLVEDGDAEVRLKMIFIRENLRIILPELMQNEEAEPYAIITHGDCWNNNMMFKYQNGELVNTCLVDFQMSRYVSPVLDLAFFIFCCTDKPFRDTYYDKILQTYHQSLAKLLAALGSDATSLFPFQKLEEHMKRFGVYGLIMATILVQFSRWEKNEIPDLEESVENIIDKEYTKRITKGSEENLLAYKKRMRDLIKDVDRYGMMCFETGPFKDMWSDYIISLEKLKIVK